MQTENPLSIKKQKRVEILTFYPKLFNNIITPKAFSYTLIFFFLFFFFQPTFSQIQPDSTANLQDTSHLVTSDSLLKAKQDSLRTVIIESLKKKSELEAPLMYSAKDSIVFDVKNRVLFLYKGASLKYQTMDLQAHKIWVDWKQNLIYAEGLWDSTLNNGQGGWKDTPVFKDEEDTYYAVKMKYNFKTKKGSILQVKTNQDGDILLGDSIRVNPDKSFFIKDGKFTTCDHDPPHFYIQSSKLKVIPNSKVISGPLYMVIEQLPIPIIIPFGYFPLNKKRTSGIVFPQYGESERLGFFFQRMGYYWAFSNYADIFFKADIYTKGSWQLGFETNYNKRYTLRGKIDFNRFREINGDKFDPDYARSTLTKLTWQHTQTIGPFATLNANVNYTTNNYFRRATFFNPTNIFNNTVQSSVNFSKIFPNTPWSLTAAANAIQYVDQQKVDLQIPTININRARTFPLKRKNKIGESRWYEQIGLDYNTSIINRVNTYDSLLFQPEILKEMSNGIKQTAGVSTGFSVLKYIRISPSISYNEYWYAKTIQKEFVERDISDTIIVKNINKFRATRDYVFTSSINTNLYGIFGTPKIRFRHTVRPNLSLVYRPDFGEAKYKNYETVQTNRVGDRIKYSIFEQSVFGGPPFGKQQALNLGIANVLEMKLPASKRDTSEKKEPRKIILIDNLGMNASYNQAADSLKWSNIMFNFRNNVLDNRININVNATLDPYHFEPRGNGFVRVNKFYWDEKKRIGRFTNWNVSISTSFQSKNPKSSQWKASKTKKREYDPVYKEYARFKIPIKLNLSYNLNYDRPFHEFKITETIRADANIQFTEKWGININTGYDLQTQKPAYTNVAITRDLHCWELRFNWIPFGQFKSYNMTINVKSQTLQDLRLQKRRVWQDNF